MKRINLIPVDVRQRNISAQKRKSRILTFVLCLLAVAVVIYWQDTKIKKMEDRIAEKKKELRDVEVSEETFKVRYEQVLMERDKVKVERQQLAKKLGLLHQSRQKNASWSTALIQISELMPDQVWLQKVYLTQDGVAIGGASIENGVVSKFMSKLDASPLFKETDFKYIQKIEVEDVPYIEFEITTDVILSEIKR